MGGFWEISHPPSFRLGLGSRLGFGLSFGLWEGWVGGFWEVPHPPSFRLGLGSRLGLGLS